VSDIEETDVNRPTEEQKERKTQATRLVELASGAVLFRSPAGTAFASVPVKNHRETHAVESRSFRDWLIRRFFSRYQKPPHEAALQSAIGVLGARARIDGPTEEVFLRVGGAESSVIIDRGDEKWQTVQIDRQGSRVRAGSNVRFRRAKGMLPLPEPFGTGSVDELRPFVNVNEDQWTLLVGWMLGALNPRGPYPILEVTGEQGSAKSTLSKVLRELIDPNTAPARAAIANERDLMIAASNGWLLVFDNLSKLSDETSDALCRISTGGSFSVRKLYENDEEMLFEAQRPIIINGIQDLAFRPDLLERSIVLDLPVLSPGKRRDEHEFWAEFAEVKPRILSALYRAVGAALENRPNVTGDKWPRMADFAKWVTAAEPALGWKPGRFLRAYENNRQQATVRVLERDGLADAVILLAENGWEGTATELLEALSVNAVQGLPRAANQLSGDLRRIAPALRLLGVSVEFERRGHDSKKVIVIREIPEPSTASTASTVGSLPPDLGCDLMGI
jgi:hypothetical protein